jgi:hypothetical protein
MGWEKHVTRTEKLIYAYSNLVGRLEGNRPLGGPGRRWEDNIKMDLREMGWKVVDWMHLTQDKDQWRALINTVINLWVP